MYLHRVPGTVHCIPGTYAVLQVLYNYMVFSVPPAHIRPLEVNAVVYCTLGTCTVLQVLYMLPSVSPAHAAHTGALEVHAAVHVHFTLGNVLQVLYMLFSVPPAHAAHAGALEVHTAVHAGAGGLGEGGGVGHHWTLCHLGLQVCQGHRRYFHASSSCVVLNRDFLQDHK